MGMGHLSSIFFDISKKLSHGPVYLCFPKESDHEPVGQAHDLSAAVAPAPAGAVLIRAAGLGHGDFAGPDSDSIAASVCQCDRKFLIGIQIHGTDRATVADDLRPGRRAAGGEEEEAAPSAQEQQDCQNGYPGLCFHRYHRFAKGIPHSIAKNR